MEETAYKLWRAMALNGLSRHGREALGMYSDAADLYNERLAAGMLLSDKDAEKFEKSSLDTVKRIAEKCQQSGTEIIFRGESAYPDRLLDLESPPEQLFVKGSLEPYERSCSVIGARNAESCAIETTYRLSYELARCGITIISGLARGIDLAAHRAAMEASGRTIAVLACGILFDYPKDHSRVKEAIAEHGALVSEYAPLEAPLHEHFLHRNRIIAALGKCVFCAQAAVHSGSMSTMRHAAAISRPLFVTPPRDALSEEYSGIVSALQSGAHQVNTVGDIIGECF